MTSKILRQSVIICLLGLATPAPAQDALATRTDQSQCTPLAGCRCMPKLLRAAALCLLDTFSILQRPGAPASLDAAANLRNLQQDGLINPKLSLDKLKELGVIEPALRLKGQP